MPDDLSFHFISGLPRVGPTLRAARLRQSPALDANTTSPLGPMMVGAMRSDTSAGNDSGVYFESAQRIAMLRRHFTSLNGATEGDHDVRACVEAVERETMLPHDLRQRYRAASIWRMPEINTPKVSVIQERPSGSEHTSR